MTNKPRERWLLPILTDRPSAITVISRSGVHSLGAGSLARLPGLYRALARLLIGGTVVFILAVAIASAGNAEVRGPKGTVPDRGERAFSLQGDLTAALALELQAALHAGFRRIFITSRGGEVLVARAMADLLNRNGALLIAQGQCHSACAYMWLATRRHQLGKEADLALHATFDDHGTNDFGELWLKELGRSDLAHWARHRDLHHLAPAELAPETAEP